MIAVSGRPMNQSASLASVSLSVRVPDPLAHRAGVDAAGVDQAGAVRRRERPPAAAASAATRSERPRGAVRVIPATQWRDVDPVASPAMSRIAVVGTGYVGLTTGACFAHLGHEVVCADIDAEKVARLSAGEIPIVEDGLDRLVDEGLRPGGCASSRRRERRRRLRDRVPVRAHAAGRRRLRRPVLHRGGGAARSARVLPPESRRRQQVDGAGRLDPGGRAGARPRRRVRSCRTPSSSARARRCTTSSTPTAS